MTSPLPKNHPTTKDSINTTIAIFGAFDIIHPGHLYFIQQALSLGKVHLVLGRDTTITKMKGRKPFHDETTRLQNIKRLDLGIDVRLGYERDAYRVLSDIKPEIILLGPDQKIFVNRLHEELARRNLTTVIKRAKPLQLDYYKSSKIRASLENKSAGFIFVDKPRDISSHNVVARLRKICDTKNIGHAGTLDPLATGVLICGIEQAKKQLSWWHIFPKTYEVSLELGKSSDTYDQEGTITTHVMKPISKKEITKILPSFLGDQKQSPPAFSAKKINGQRAYHLARKQKDVKLKKISVHIYELTLQYYNNPHLKLRVTCTSGTYIRSLVHDIGKRLGTHAIMTELKRTTIGPANLKNTLTLEKLTKNDCTQNLYPVALLLEKINTHYLTHLRLA